MYEKNIRLSCVKAWHKAGAANGRDLKQKSCVIRSPAVVEREEWGYCHSCCYCDPMDGPNRLGSDFDELPSVLIGPEAGKVTAI